MQALSGAIGRVALEVRADGVAVRLAQIPGTRSGRVGHRQYERLALRRGRRFLRGGRTARSRQQRGDEQTRQHTGKPSLMRMHPCNLQVDWGKSIIRGRRVVNPPPSPPALMGAADDRGLAASKVRATATRSLRSERFAGVAPTTVR